MLVPSIVLVGSFAPVVDALVLCGHTHGQGSVRMLPNLVVETGGAEYGAPRIQSVIDV